jgi:hypothetical protein
VQEVGGGEAGLQGVLAARGDVGTSEERLADCESIREGEEREGEGLERGGEGEGGNHISTN